MRFTEFLEAEWVPALGCTEPAAVAYATALAAEQGTGAVHTVRLVCDPRTYKNCYAVGLPNTEHRTGLLWTLAIGAHLPDSTLGLRCFGGVTQEILMRAQGLLDRLGVTVDVDSQREGLWIDVQVVRETGVGRAVLAREHTNLLCLEADGRVLRGASGERLMASKRDFRADAGFTRRTDTNQAFFANRVSTKSNPKAKIILFFSRCQRPST